MLATFSTTVWKVLKETESSQEQTQEISINTMKNSSNPTVTGTDIRNKPQRAGEKVSQSAVYRRLHD